MYRLLATTFKENILVKVSSFWTNSGLLNLVIHLICDFWWFSKIKFTIKGQSFAAKKRKDVLHRGYQSISSSPSSTTIQLCHSPELLTRLVK